MTVVFQSNSHVLSGQPALPETPTDSTTPFVMDTRSGATRELSLSLPDGTVFNGTGAPSLSGDGARIAVEGTYRSATPVDGSTSSDVFVADLG